MALSVIMLLTTDTSWSQETVKTKSMKIEIWSDVSCPFCYIGKKHLESALKKYDGTENVEIVWKSFMLDPTLPEVNDQSVYEMLSEKKGIPLGQVKQMTAHVERMGKEAGIDYDFSKPKSVNTYKAHLLIQLAKQHNLGEKAEEQLFQAYFMRGLSVADSSVLMQIGKEIGLSDEALSELFTQQDLKVRVEADLYEARTIGISGVPFFLFNDRYAISGAQPVEAFLQTLQKVGQLEAVEMRKTPVSGASCEPEGKCD